MLTSMLNFFGRTMICSLDGVLTACQMLVANTDLCQYVARDVPHGIPIPS